MDVKYCHIDDEDGEKLDCFGYCSNIFKSIIYYLLGCCTGGFIFLVAYWRPDWALKFKCSPCTLKKATQVLLKTSYGAWFVEEIQTIIVDKERSHSNSTCTVEFDEAANCNHYDETERLLGVADSGGLNGIFADQWKCALVHPLLKKLGLIFQNFRPVSNLQYISKLTEKAVFIQTHGQMVTHNIYPELQSSYHEHHSTETALLKVMNDVLLKMNSQHVTLLILLDLSAAFDTVDHSILLDRLTKIVGLQGKALGVYRNTYLRNIDNH